MEILVQLSKDENSKLNPLTAYAKSKVDFERYLNLLKIIK